MENDLKNVTVITGKKGSLTREQKLELAEALRKEAGLEKVEGEEEDESDDEDDEEGEDSDSDDDGGVGFTGAWKRVALNQIPYMVRTKADGKEMSLGVCAPWFDFSALNEATDSNSVDLALDAQLRQMLHVNSAANGYFCLLALRSGRFAGAIFKNNAVSPNAVQYKVNAPQQLSPRSMQKAAGGSGTGITCVVHKVFRRYTQR